MLFELKCNSFVLYCFCLWAEKPTGKAMLYSTNSLKRSKDGGLKSHLFHLIQCFWTFNSLNFQGSQSHFQQLLPPETKYLLLLLVQPRPQCSNACVQLMVIGGDHSQICPMLHSLWFAILTFLLSLFFPAIAIIFYSPE